MRDPSRPLRMTGSWADTGAVVFLAVCALVLHRDGLLGAVLFFERDTELFYYPLAQWVGEQLKAGQYPLWVPGIFTGYPIFADGELGLLYLPQVALLWLLPTPVAIVWLRVLHAFLAGLFTFLFLRTLRLDPLPALGGALVFAFGSFLTAQMHHENMVRSAVWLPAVLTCVERAVRTPSRARGLAWAGLGALAFAQSALGLHVQPVLMTALAVGGYVLFRALTCRHWWPLVVGAAIGLGGAGLAAAQMLPLGEWALLSFRRGGVSYEFASAFGLPLENLPTLLFPYFFRLPDASNWWTLWQQWEITLYVGIPTLALIVVGVVFARHATLLYFVPLGVVSLLIAHGAAGAAPQSAPAAVVDPRLLVSARAGPILVSDRVCLRRAGGARSPGAGRPPAAHAGGPGRGAADGRAPGRRSGAAAGVPRSRVHRSRCTAPTWRRARSTGSIPLPSSTDSRARSSSATRKRCGASPCCC